MKYFRQITNFLLAIIFTAFMVFIFMKEYNMIYVVIAALLTFFGEFLYYIVEQRSDVVLISTGNIYTHRRNSIVILIFAVLTIFISIYDNGVVIRNLIPGIIFCFLGLRGVLFTRQTVASVRIYEQGFEYGFWNRFITWDKVINYKTLTEENKIFIEKSGLFGKTISIRFDNSTDLMKFENFLEQ